MSSLIYVVEDEENIREIIVCTLEAFSYRTKSFEDAESMLKSVTAEKPGLIMLDIMLPGMDGSAALKVLKSNASTSDIPVIMLTAKAAETEKVANLDAGADDYITKPFGVLELSARVRAALRKQNKQAPATAVLIYKDIVADRKKRSVKTAGIEVELTLKEYELLCLLLSNPERVVTREELLAGVWGFNFEGESRTLDMHIKTLRQKLGDNADRPKYIKTVRGVGYALIPE